MSERWSEMANINDWVRCRITDEAVERLQEIHREERVRELIIPRDDDKRVHCQLWQLMHLIGPACTWGGQVLDGPIERTEEVQDAEQ